MRKASSMLSVGDKFNRWTVISAEPIMKGGGRYWLCRCDCGKEKMVRGSVLRSGASKSCGCLTREMNIDRNTTHGMFGTRPYSAWHNLKDRCNNPNYHQYARYGGRGITYDPKWETFEGFWEDMQDGYSDELSLDRIDNDGNYCKENCKWSTRKEQMNNKTDNHYITYDGRTQTMTQWARELGMKDHTLSNRLCKGWGIERAFTQPIKTTKQ